MGVLKLLAIRWLWMMKPKDSFATKGYDVQFGARPLKRAIQNYLEDGLSELIISAGVQPGDTINVSVNKEKKMSWI